MCSAGQMVISHPRPKPRRRSYT